ncbi:MAG TPA: HD domain-containing protein [Solirubrobacterales bacterium]|jgi:3'-5' exoribonuclease|nr:HD domain-containing protein [Solirubrobacterales bacterium]
MSEQTLFPTPDQPDVTEAAPAPVSPIDQDALSTPAERIALRDLEDGQRLGGVYAVRQRELRRKRNGEPWLRLSVGDSTGTAEAVCWEDAETLYALCGTGTAIHVTGVFEMSERWGAKIKIAALREAEPHEFEADELAPESDVAVDDLEADLRSLLATIQDPELRLLLDSFFTPGSEAWARFRDAPAAKTYHQAYRHGLLEHTLSVAQAVSAASNFFPGIDREVAVTGALLHDIGKTEAYNDDPLAIDLTDLGRLQGEIPLGYYLVRRQIEELPGFDPALAQAVLHIILSHHGQLEHGSPVIPATREAVLVHMIDNLGGRLGSFDRLERQLPAGESWSGFDRALSGSAYFGQRAAA